MHEFSTYQDDLKSILDESVEYDLKYIDRDIDQYVLTLHNGIIYNGKVILNKRPYYRDNRYHPTFNVEVIPKPKQSSIAIKRIHKPVHVDHVTMPFHKFSKNIYHSFLCDNNTFLNSEMNAFLTSKNNIFVPVQNGITTFIVDHFFPTHSTFNNTSFTFDTLQIINSGRVIYIDDTSRLSHLIEKLRRLFIKSTSCSIEKLFTYRTRGGRQIENLPEVINTLSAKGFTCMSDIELTKLSLYEQADLFSGLEEYISIHDASLYNIVYCSPKTVITVLEPLKVHEEQNEDAFKKVCAVLDLMYNPVDIQGDCSWRDSSYYLNCSTWA
jgi:hypothetical protein